MPPGGAMPKGRCCGFAALLLLGLALAAARAAAVSEGAAAGAISGALRWGGAGDGFSTAGRKLRLEVFLEGRPTATLTAVSDRRGRVFFSRLRTDPSYSYALVFPYQGIDYNSGLHSFPAGLRTLELQVFAYPVRAQPIALRLPFAHFLVFPPAPGETELLCRLTLMLENPSPWTWRPATAAPRSGAAVPLPRQASEVQVAGDFPLQAATVEEETVWLNLPLPPGTMQMQLEFRLPIRRGRAALDLPQPLPGGNWLLLAPDRAIQFSGPGVRQLGAQELAPGKLFTAAELHPGGGGIHVDVSGWSAASRGPRGLLILLLPLLGMALWLDRRYKKSGRRDW